jgi:hypothetical protein
MPILVGSRLQALSAKALSRDWLAPLAKPPQPFEAFLAARKFFTLLPSPLLLPRSLAILKNVVPSQLAPSKLPVTFPAIVTTPSTIILRSERFLRFTDAFTGTERSEDSSALSFRSEKSSEQI